MHARCEARVIACRSFGRAAIDRMSGRSVASFRKAGIGLPGKARFGVRFACCIASRESSFGFRGFGFLGFRARRVALCYGRIPVVWRPGGIAVP